MSFFAYFSLFSLLLLFGGVVLLAWGVMTRRKTILYTAASLFVLLGGMWVALMRFLTAV